MAPHVIARSVWGAAPASLPDAAMRLPATEVFIHHSATGVSPDVYADVRLIEKIGLQRFGQFSYSYVIHPRDGEILEGCGPRRGAHTAQRNSTSFGICWVGNYEVRAPKVQQIESTRWLIHHLTEQGWLDPGADILPHRSVTATACPGSKILSVFDALRVPWEGPMPDRPRVDAPVVGGFPAYRAVYDDTGRLAGLDVKGYALVGADGGVFTFGEGVEVLGNVEHVRPDGREWLPKA